MKIAYLLGSLNRGGTETLLLDVFRNAVSNQLDAIGIYRKTGVCEQDFQASGVPLFQLKPGKNTLIYLYQLRALLINQRVDIVHAQQAIDALYAYMALWGTGIRIVLSTHGFDYSDTTIAKTIQGFILKHTDINIFVSAYQKKYFTAKYHLKPEKQKVIYNGISFDKLAVNDNSAGTEKTLRNELQLSSDTLLLGTVGNFNLVRDQFTLCRFLKLIADAGVKFHFVFVGKRIDTMGERYDTCVAYCRDNGLSEKVSFLGVRHDVPQILHSLDAFLYATDHDTFGIAVVEAMACGLPVFVNNWEVMTEITENGRLANIYKTKDEQDLYRQFSLFLQDKKQFADKALKSQQEVNKKYSIQKHIEEIKNTYKSI